MKKMILSAIASFCLLSSANAYDSYFETSLLYTVPSDLEVSNSYGNSEKVDVDGGYSLSFTLGNSLSRDFDIELQYSYDDIETKNIDKNIIINTLFLNTIYKLNINSKNMHPYIGAGIGYASYDNGYGSDEVAAYQAFIGNSFDIDYGLEFFVEYRYKDFDNVEIDGLSFDDTSIHGIGIGLKQRF